MKCFVNVLKATINNENLPIWNQIPLLLLKNNTSHSTSFFVGNTNGENITLVCDENCLFDNNQRSIVLNGSGAVSYTLTGDAVVKIKPYKNLKQLITGASSASSGTGAGQYLVDPGILSKFPSLEEFSIRTLTSLHQLDNVCPNLKYLGLQNSDSYSSVDDKNIAILGTHTKLLYIFLNNSQIGGALEDLAAAQVSAGRTTGTLGICCNNVVTYNGSVVGNNIYKYIHFNVSYTGGYQITDSLTPPTP